MVTEQAIVHFANKTGRTFEKAQKYLSDLKRKADRDGYATKHPTNSEWSEVNVWRDKTTGHVIWVVNDSVVHVVVSKKSPRTNNVE